MKNVKVEVTHHDDRGDPEPPDNYTVELRIGEHRFGLAFYAFTNKEKAEKIAAEVRMTLGIKTTPATVSLSEVEKKRADEFTIVHPYGCGKADDFSIRYVATGVGTKKVITCHGCNEEKDLSDYESW